MAIQNSVNSMLGTAVMAAGSSALKGGLKDMEASKIAQESLNDKIQAMNEQNMRFRQRLAQQFKQDGVPVIDQPDAIRIVKNVKLPGGK